MADFTIYIGNKNYSSWSLRGWLPLKQTGAAFKEVVIPLYIPGSHEEILRHSPSGKVPALQHGTRNIWESLAIGEYLAEIFPEVRLWPEDAGARAFARAVSTEMHAGFANLRRELTMNMRRSIPGVVPSPDAQAEIDRIQEIWRTCRARYGDGGPFLFGHFTVADAMYAPVVTRFRTYHVALDRECEAYAAAVWALPSMQEWLTAAQREKIIIEKFELNPAQASSEASRA